MNEQQTELQRFHRDATYYASHRDDLLAKYPESWVAIFNEQVVGAANDFNELLADLRRRGIPTEKAVVEYVTSKEETLILPS